MKKLLFVVPKVLFINILVFLIITFLPFKTSAVDNTGCVISFGSELHVYYLLNPITPGSYITSTDDPTTPGGYRRKRASDVSVCVDNFGGSCSIYFTNGTILFTTGNTSHIYDCPIDDYLPAILITIASIGFLQIRKIPIFNSENENLDHHRSL